MTPEEELELLIAEQQHDDTYFIDRREGEISLDAPTPDRTRTIHDLIGVDEDGEVVTFLRNAAHLNYSPLRDPRQTVHGTIYAYRRLRCKCAPCKAAQAKAVREYRARRRAGS